VRLAKAVCFELPGPHFDFNLSFVRQDGLADLGAVVPELTADDLRKAMVYGHTDTVGKEPYNKKLSERRARAALAVLTHDTDAWEKLYQEENWGLKPVQAMLNALGASPPLDPDGQYGPLTKAATEAFQGQHPPLDVDGKPGKNTRRELFLAYFKLATATPVKKEQFRDFGGERIMGCAEFNPFTPDNQIRDENSRRVVVMVYDPAADPGNLPCVIGDIGPCHANLIGEGEPPPDPKNPFFRCKIFVKVSQMCPCGLPPLDADADWDVPPVDPTPGDPGQQAPGATWDVSSDGVEPAPGELGAAAPDASFDPGDDAIEPTPGQAGVTSPEASWDLGDFEPSEGDLGTSPVGPDAGDVSQPARPPLFPDTPP
jgi:hypothetical protein